MQKMIIWFCQNQDNNRIFHLQCHLKIPTIFNLRLVLNFHNKASNLRSPIYQLKQKQRTTHKKLLNSNIKINIIFLILVLCYCLIAKIINVKDFKNQYLQIKDSDSLTFHDKYISVYAHLVSNKQKKRIISDFL